MSWIRDLFGGGAVDQRQHAPDTPISDIPSDSSIAVNEESTPAPLEMEQEHRGSAPMSISEASGTSGISETTAVATPVDAVTAEVLRNAIMAISREMKTNLARTAYNTIIYEAEDFTVGI